MQFKEFVQKLFSAISDGESTSSFTKTMLENIVTEKGLDILNGYQPSSYRAYYNGNTSITKISKKINAHIEHMEFVAYIGDLSDASVEQLCRIFKEDIPNIEPLNAPEKLAELFAKIITDAAGAKKKTFTKSKKLKSDEPVEISISGVSEHTPKPQTFKKYLTSASTYYSTKKTLLYAEEPRPFYELYVCNDIQRHNRLLYLEDAIRDVTIKKLEKEAKYIIIQGLGGIGKSMLLTHLFLSSAKQVETTDSIPLMLSLKDYKDTTITMIDFICKSVNEYDSDISTAEITDFLRQKRLILLLDGLDEIQLSSRDAFNQSLEVLIKSYPGNTIVITSRPVNSFISYSKFTIFDIQDLTKEQALELIRKIDFWDKDGKNSFLEALDSNLYNTHREFASNPLLLTIMLMTYSSFGEVPAKMHVFYSKAYETMARLHDASKGSFKRPFHTGLTPEEFAKYFAKFCAMTYKDEILEFDSSSFASYMEKVLKTGKSEHQSISSRDFLLDLTENLCIMYQEGEHYYFIHRSFQEYFAAVCFSSGYDDKLIKVGDFFEKANNRSYTDRTFDMLYDMIPEKVERFVFLPFLEHLLGSFEKEGMGEYWEFLEKLYPFIYFGEVTSDELYFNTANSFLYRFIIKEKQLAIEFEPYNYDWPNDVYNFVDKVWVDAYIEFLDDEAYERFPDCKSIPKDLLRYTTLVEESELPHLYFDYFGKPNVEGVTIGINIKKLRENSKQYTMLKNYMEQDDFPLFREYRNIRNYYHNLKKRTKLETSSDDLFDN
ncbi:NACHT domain-containing protein [Catonella massiliensis]|jgi:hypothetical protein|uniref:NACHT domain-containing protein n=1 Tax=Catonella massiliensis TaxID=2799636 RepID=A0ABS1J1W2_9FIRM|nr:NACHT domain-containing protein [Catonella massiliensis]MBK5898037.1 NACHT domain-containing protein [Catonella massiliensis]